jgi:Fic family protein
MDLFAYEIQQLSFFEPPADVQEVYNYVQALEYGLKRLGSLPLSLRLIREIHARLMEGVRGGYQTPGEFRRSQNWIGPPGCTLGEVTFVPPPVTEMHEALNDLKAYLHATALLPPLVRVGLIHYQFEAIHPFLDGNGRVGRLLVTLLLCAWRLLSEPLLYLSAYLAAQRQAYYDLLLAVSQEGKWEAWLTFFLDGVASQARDGVVRAGQMQALREGYRSQFQATRASARLLQVIDLLFAQPIVRVDQIEAALGVSTPAAQNYINRLEDAGILREVTGRSRNRVYQADGVLAAMEEPLDDAGT